MRSPRPPAAPLLALLAFVPLAAACVVQATDEVAANGGSPSPAAALAPDRAAAIADSARAVVADLARLGREGKLDSLAAHYSPDPAFRFYESGAVQYASAAAVAEGLTQLPPGTAVDTEYEDVHPIALAPGVAHVGARFRTTFRGGPMDGVSFAGAQTLVLRHEAEGWRIVAGHTSVPVPRGG